MLLTLNERCAAGAGCHAACLHAPERVEGEGLAALLCTIVFLKIYTEKRCQCVLLYFYKKKKPCSNYLLLIITL